MNSSDPTQPIADLSVNLLHRSFRRHLLALRSKEALSRLTPEQLVLLNAMLGTVVRDLCLPKKQNMTGFYPPVRPFEPTPEQIWRPGMRDESGRRIYAMEAFERGFGAIPLEERPFAHQIRQHPLTRSLYDCLSVKLSRNREERQKPDSLGDLFRLHPQAMALGGGRRRSETGLSAPASLAP